jgi:endoglucanase
MSDAANVTHKPLDIFAATERLGRGVNLDNTLEAHNQKGDPGLVLRASHFSHIARAGFDSVRIPIRWSTFADKQSPYAIDPHLFNRVDWALTQAKRNDLAAIIDFHDYHEITMDPDNHTDRFLALWRQIADRYQSEPETVYFELLNEPKGALTVERWNELLPQAIGAIRNSNPTRPLIVGSANWSNVLCVDTLLLPPDPHLIVTFHYYQPMPFTHQGAQWVDGADSWLGTAWEGNKFERLTVTASLDRAAAWAQERHRPLFMGEFGAICKADLASRERWVRFVAQRAMERGISLAYWQFGADFDLYDRRWGRWNRRILDAVMGRETKATWWEQARRLLRRSPVEAAAVQER